LGYELELHAAPSRWQQTWHREAGDSRQWSAACTRTSAASCPRSPPTQSQGTWQWESIEQLFKYTF